VTRRYESPRRSAQAAATERSIIDAAHRLVLEHGYGATSISQIATAAGVSAQTVYNGFGTKAALVKRVYDVVLVGDVEAVPVADRPDYEALFADPDPTTFLEQWVHLNREVTERVGPLLRVLAAGATSGDEELRQFITTVDDERLVGVTQMANRLKALKALKRGTTVERARDEIWALTGVELHDLLVTKRGWTPTELERWQVTTIRTAVLVP
jgi:AcrR family transcriptional regulator